MYGMVSGPRGLLRDGAAARGVAKAVLEQIVWSNVDVLAVVRRQVIVGLPEESQSDRVLPRLHGHC